MNSKEYKPIMVTGPYTCGKGALITLLDSPLIFTIPQWHDMLIDIFYRFVEDYKRYTDNTHWRGKDDRVIMLHKKLAEQDYPMLEQYAIMKKLPLPITSTRYEYYDFDFDYYKQRAEFFETVWSLDSKDISVKTLFNIFADTVIKNFHNAPKNDYKYFVSASEPGFCDFGNLIQVYPEIKIIYIYRKDWIYAFSNRCKAQGFDTCGIKNDARFNGIIKAETQRQYFEKKYPDNFKVIDFDELINHPEVTARNVIDFIGLRWDEIYGIPTFSGKNLEATEIVGKELDSKDNNFLLPDEENEVRAIYESALHQARLVIDNARINYLEQAETSEIVESKDISVVVQGSIDFQETKKCLNSVRKNLPGAEIILSTWQDAKTEDLDYDILVLSSDPGGTSMEPVTWKTNNVNRQITSTLNGIKRATRKYVLKIRTDSSILNLGFLKYYNAQIISTLKREKEYSVFNKRVLIDSYFTRDPICGEYRLCFHPSDLWFFGLKEDLENLFAIPLQEKFIVTINGCKFQYRTPEQYIWTSCLEKNGFSFFLDSAVHNTPLLATISTKSILNNFIVLDHKLCGISFPAKFKAYPKHTFKFIFNTARYFESYKNIYDNNYDIPERFKYGSIKGLLGITEYIGELKNNCLYRFLRCIFWISVKVISNGYKLIWKS